MIRNSNSVKINVNSGKSSVRRARGALHPCARCNGMGSLMSIMNGSVTCPTCKGKGVNRV